MALSKEFWVSRFTGTWNGGMEQWNGGIVEWWNGGTVGGAANLTLTNDKMRYLRAQCLKASRS